MTKYGWFDFATPRPSLDSLLKGIREEGGGAPSVAKGGDEGPTRSEIISAQQKAVGGKPKRCVKGKACSATCIFAGNDCLVELDPAVGRGVGQARDMIQGAVKRGVISPEEGQRMFEKYTGLGKIDSEKDLGEEGKGGKRVLSKEAKAVLQKEGIKERAAELTQAFKELERDFPDPKQREEVAARIVEGVLGTAYRPKNVGALISEDEVEGVASPKQQKLIKDMALTYDKAQSGQIKTSEEMRDSLKPVNAVYRPREATDGEVRLALAMMPGEARNYLMKAGTVEEGGLFGPSPKGYAIPERYGPVQRASKEDQMGRAFLITRVGVESNWTDIYTGKKIFVLEADLEHGIPASVGGKLSEQGANYYLTKSRLNRGKSDKSPDYFEVGRKDGYFDAVASGKKTGKKEFITFDAEGKLTARGRELHRAREGSLAGKQTYESQILSKALDPRQAIAAIASSGLGASDRTSLIGKVVATWVDNVPRTVGIAMQSAKPGKLTRAAQQWYWYGKDAAGVNFGNKLANKVADLREAGDTKGLLKLGGIMRNIQTELLSINEREWNGQKIRKLTLGPQNPGSRDAVTEMIKGVRDKYLEEIEAL